MHDIWNPFHGCVKYSEGCANCYMYYLDEIRDMDGSEIYKTKGGFDYPLQKRRDGSYKVRPGELIRVCMTSDFFMAEADEWRDETWDIMYRRSDVKFFLLTKRAERIAEHLPDNWGDGYDNVILNVTCENQHRADERIPILLDIPAKHKGIMCAPLLGPISISEYLDAGQLEQVLAGGENYAGARPCDFSWVKTLHDECVAHDVTFCFTETGTRFVKDGKEYNMPNKVLQAEMAYKSGMNYIGKPIEWNLVDSFGRPIPKEELHVPQFLKENCKHCGSRIICNGCSDCGRCK